MKSYEIERKYLIHTIPFDLKEYAFHDIEQGYLCTEPVVRIRKQMTLIISLTNPKG